MATLRAAVIGDCEVCDNKQVAVWTMQGNILMCETCKADELHVIEQSLAAAQLVSDSRKVDESIQVKTDLFNAATIPAIELRAAIEQNDSIAPADKEYAYAKECMDRFQHLQKVIFDERQALLVKENELRVWQVQVQTTAGKLRADLREHFKALNVSYQPVPVKVIKPKESKPTKRFNLAEIKEAAAKYGVDASGVQMIAKQRNMSAEDAAKFFAQQMGLVK